MDERLQALMQELGNAINDSVNDSDRIASAIAEIKKLGFNVSIVLEVNINLNKIEEGSEEEVKESGPLDHGLEFRLTLSDMEFLKAIKISVDQ